MIFQVGIITAATSQKTGRGWGAPWKYDRFAVQATQLDSGPFSNQCMEGDRWPPQDPGVYWQRQDVEQAPHTRLDQPDPLWVRDG